MQKDRHKISHNAEQDIFFQVHIFKAKVLEQYNDFFKRAFSLHSYQGGVLLKLSILSDSAEFKFEVAEHKLLLGLAKQTRRSSVNQQLCSQLASWLAIDPSQVKIHKGLRCRHKIILLLNQSADLIAKKLHTILYENQN